MTIINRATIEPAVVEGRTLEGIAYRYDHPSRVSDDGRSFYLEEFAPGCDAKTIADRANVFPVGWFHPWSSNAGRAPSQPLGSVRFTNSDTEAALMFQATISKTQLGDEALELVRDRAAEDVSVSYRIRSTITRLNTRRERIQRRTEIAIRELSLAPTGLGQHEDARVLAMRAEHVPDDEARHELTRLEQSRRRRLLL